MEEKRYLVDLMLLRLGRWLRLMGQDVANPEGDSDRSLQAQAKKENRILITRDKRLAAACLSADVECVLIRSSQVADQILEMADLGLALQIDPQRCTLCNSLLIDCGDSQLENWQCPCCKKLYWKGGHWKNMEDMLECIRSKRDKGDAGRETGGKGIEQ